MDMHLEDKVVIVTGAGAGIGAATAKLFVDEGAKAIIADYDGAAAEAVAGPLGPNARAFTLDVSKADECKGMIDFAVAEFGGLDVLVNNAGRGSLGTVETQDEEDWHGIIDVNLTGVYLCSKFAVPELRKRGGGAIVNTASNIAMAMAIKDRAAYVAAKGGVASLTRAMALDFAPDNIRVNSVAPGVIWSNYYTKMLTQVPDSEAFKAGLRARAPSNSWGEPDDIASAIVWLASDRARFAVGTMLTVDGGASIW